MRLSGGRLVCEEPPEKAGLCIGFHEDGESGVFFRMGKIIDAGRGRRSVCIHQCHVTCVKFTQVYLFFSFINASYFKKPMTQLFILEGFICLNLVSCVAENSHLCVWALSLHFIIFSSLSRLFMFFLGYKCTEGTNSSICSIIPLLLEEYRYTRFGTSVLFHMANIFTLPFV